jgi:hypothetical protein
MKSLQELQRTWEGLAQADPLWAICTDPAKQHKQWSREEFFTTGKNEVGVVLKCVAGLGMRIDPGLWRNTLLNAGAWTFHPP